jgi:hypothetical protein
MFNSQFNPAVPSGTSAIGHRRSQRTINKKPRIGGRGGVSVLSVSLQSETPAVPVPPAAGKQQIYQQ